MDRRTFFLSGAAAMLGASAAVRPPAGRLIGAPSDPMFLPLDGVLVDRRVAPGRAFAAAAARLGLPVTWFDGDLTTVWRDTLRSRWAAGAGAIAGMTTPAGLLCLEQMAMDQWRRVVVRIEHRGVERVPSHRLTAALPMLERAAAALDDPRRWPARLCTVLSSCERAKDRARFTRIVSADPSLGRWGAPELVTWVIAS